MFGVQLSAGNNKASLWIGNSSVSFDSHNSDQIILSFVYSDNLSKGPLSWNKTIFLKNDDISNRGISRWVMPLRELPKTTLKTIIARSGVLDSGTNANNEGEK